MVTNESSGLILLDKHQKEIKDDKSFEEKLDTIFQEEYDENLEDILILEEESFLQQIKDGVYLIIENMFPDISLTDEKITNLIAENMENIHKKYNHDFFLINKEYSSYIKLSKRRTNSDSLLKRFRKHCLYTEEYASHNCCPIKEVGKQNNSCHFICVYSADMKRKIKFVVCELCKKVYYSSYILSLCNKCNVEYYTSILSSEENPDLLLATWENYHCPQLINEKMKCIQCREFFYLNMKNGFLTCLNKKCEFSIKPSRILWTCIVCKTEFKNGVKPYNPLDIIFTKKLIEQTIFLKHKAHPTKLPCCKLNVFFTEFYHKKGCHGILYQSEFNDRIIIVCEKCRGINFIDRFKWTCPKCGKKFMDKNKDNEFNNNKKNNNKEYNSQKKTEKSINDNNDKKGGNSFTPKLSMYTRKRFKTQIEQELLNQFKLDDDKNKDETHNEDNEDNKKEEKNNEEIKGESYIDDIGKRKVNSYRKYRKFRKENEDNNVIISNDDEEIKINPIKIESTKSSSRNSNNNMVKKANTNMGGFKRSKDINNELDDNEKMDKETKKKSLFNKNIENIEIEKTKQMISLSPRLKWKKINQDAEEKKKKVLSLYAVNNNNNQKKEEKEINLNEEVKEKKEKGINKNEEKEEKEETEETEEILKKKEENEEKLYPKSPSPKRKRFNFFKQLEKSEKEISPSPQNTKNPNTYDDKTKDNDKKEESEEENIEDTMANLLLNEEEFEDYSSDKEIVMSKIPGVSENYFNIVNKKINAILERCKIPVFNFEDYVFDKKLGEGGYAVIFSVYKTNDENYKEYAMKKIIASSMEDIDKFTKEFELVYSCDHPNIMKIYGLCIRMLDQTTFSLYVLMERAKKDWDADIKKHLKKKKNYTEKELINILRQLSDALLFMQKKLKISHRDIKPQNVLLFSNGIFKISDFGEAKEMKIDKQINTLRGTELYMSPALYWGLKNNNRDVNHDPYKSDVFSLGFCFLYAAALNFKLLYQVREVYNNNQMNQILNQQFSKKYSATFINILSYMLEVDETKRYDFSELIQAIDANYDKDGNLKNLENNEGKKRE